MARFRAYATAVEPLSHALATGCAWGSSDQQAIWTQAVRTIAATVDELQLGNSYLAAMREYPVHVVVYAAAVGALSRKNYGALRAANIDPFVRSRGGRESVIHHLAPYRYLHPFELAATLLANESEGKEIPDDKVQDWSSRGGLRFTPISDALHALIRPILHDLVPDDTDYTELFDEVEVLLGVLAEDSYLYVKDTQNVYLTGGWFGRFTWREQYASTAPVHRRMEAELKSAGAAWAPLKAGLFGGSYERAIRAFDSFNASAKRTMNRLH